MSARIVEDALPTIIALPDGCWLWTRSQNHSGYGQWRKRDEDRLRPAHAVVFETFNGPPPPGMYHDHLCSFRLCVNPAHIERATMTENLRRRDEAVRRRNHARKSLAAVSQT